MTGFRRKDPAFGVKLPRQAMLHSGKGAASHYIVPSANGGIGVAYGANFNCFQGRIASIDHADQRAEKASLARRRLRR
jgi:hypothetical protein